MRRSTDRAILEKKPFIRLLEEADRPIILVDRVSRNETA
jgi:hypothetical protein